MLKFGYYIKYLNTPPPNSSPPIEIILREVDLQCLTPFLQLGLPSDVRHTVTVELLEDPRSAVLHQGNIQVSTSQGSVPTSGHDTETPTLHLQDGYVERAATEVEDWL